MRTHRVSGQAMVALSSVALATVLIGLTRPPEPPGSDEGALAHIFQLSVAATVPMILLFLATSDWSKPSRSLRPLAVSLFILILAFGALYYLEHRS